MHFVCLFVCFTLRPPTPPTPSTPLFNLMNNPPLHEMYEADARKYTKYNRPTMLFLLWSLINSSQYDAADILQHDQRDTEPRFLYSDERSRDVCFLGLEIKTNIFFFFPRLFWCLYYMFFHHTSHLKRPVLPSVRFFFFSAEPTNNLCYWKTMAHDQISNYWPQSF